MYPEKYKLDRSAKVLKLGKGHARAFFGDELTLLDDDASYNGALFIIVAIAPALLPPRGLDRIQTLMFLKNCWQLTD